MGKYGDRGKKKGKGGHRCRYMENDQINALCGLYKDPKDNDDDGRDNDNNNDDRDYMEEKEQEEDNNGDDDVVDITAVQLFGMPGKAFLGKETENKKKKEEQKDKK